MEYLNVLKKNPDMVSPGVSACQGCGGELILRRVMQVAGQNSILCVPPGCMAGSGVVGWNYDTGMKVPIHIPLLDNSASFLTGVTHLYRRLGREDVNLIAFAGDGASADCGFQSLSGAAERGERILYICYDNEGYMNTGYQRSSTTTLGSRTSTCATASPWNMKDLMEKVQKGLEASKEGFAYLHMFSPCPTGWSFGQDQTIQVAKRAVRSNMFPIWEKSCDGYKLNYVNQTPISIREFVAGIGKFKNLSEEQLDRIQRSADERYAAIKALCGI